LLIGLVTGRQPVEFLVGRPVECVRVLLDERELEVLRAPPWTVEVDFGEDPVPHRLEVRGATATGTEVARAEQWINVPRPNVELEVVLEASAAGKINAARLAWATARAQEPAAVRITIDGAGVRWTGDKLLSLGELDPAIPHLLRVEIEFPDGSTAWKELVFGAGFRERVDAALTAIAVESSRSWKAPRLKRVGASLRSGARLQIVAIEQGLAHAVVVIDPRAREALAKASRTLGATERVRGPGNSMTYYDVEVPCDRPSPSLDPGDDDLLFLDPNPESFVRDARISWIFRVWQQRSVRLRDVGILAGRMDLAPHESSIPLLADAVANAGLLAASGARRRAVVLITVDDKVAGHIKPVAAARLLDELGVPLVVWSPMVSHLQGVAAVWGNAVDVSSCDTLARASLGLEELLARQGLIWVEGRHLLRDIVIDSARLKRVGATRIRS
jgi:hypothetical protein